MQGNTPVIWVKKRPQRSRHGPRMARIPPIVRCNARRRLYTTFVHTGVPFDRGWRLASIGGRRRSLQAGQVRDGWVMPGRLHHPRPRNWPRTCGSIAQRAGRENAAPDHPGAGAITTPVPPASAKSPAHRPSANGPRPSRPAAPESGAMMRWSPQPLRRPSSGPHAGTAAPA